ncbi:MAG: bifunctional (p)ppGpp synthetase/guanosine-3',5'-bis(diphosphate) 3'-pyrophosphohydrolase [Betaproteobacteria bacterium]|nr:bifunctional (p)ppGpp synthetase/guanosine-3',5'-bis(diphosphate) 3'-pyrophosphohydrolase [Betaproteobacteria bacterium]
MAKPRPITHHPSPITGGAGGVALILKALEFAAHKHRDQRRKDRRASPYINHPIQLANVLWQEGGVSDPAAVAAALLHDTIEDTETTWQELRGEFGDEIAGVVLEVTDVKWLKKTVRKRLQVAKARHASERARLVKLADKICNLRDVAAHPPAKWDLARRREYFEWAKEVVDQLRGTHPELERRFDEIYALKP